jgi:hypothetical protein
MPALVHGFHPREAGQTFRFIEMMEGKMFNNSRLPWFNDPMNLTLSVVLIAASIAVYFIAVRGWAW